ncbi:hypothetical protein L211DRAFT_36233 [Terfezia boudieri ATCC MYA-4762]|uniref:Uncharacterized protein n=1 Tax=Terfezia boudieri ATCC MYA-4762 TaxID=1051890 RepID=A0A3N4MCM4_9PEZI|nr:hypothetical protein L211DRAFT_36233 [Terfezia boudieri ATCC MYA-4762]
MGMHTRSKKGTGVGGALVHVFGLGFSRFAASLGGGGGSGAQPTIKKLTLKKLDLINLYILPGDLSMEILFDHSTIFVLSFPSPPNPRPSTSSPTPTPFKTSTSSRPQRPSAPSQPPCAHSPHHPLKELPLHHPPSPPPSAPPPLKGRLLEINPPCTVTIRELALACDRTQWEYLAVIISFLT